MPNSNSVLIVSSTSGMARATADAFARRGYALVLAARDEAENERIAQDLRIRHQVEVLTLAYDAEAFDTHEPLLQEVAATAGGLPQGLIFFTGYMADQCAAEKNFALARRMVDVNVTSAISIIEPFAAQCEARRGGFIGIVSSAAGDRGKQSNYIYGATKAALTVYAQGLRNRLYPSGVTVTTIKPGFVDTKMTYGMKLPRALTATPEQAGEAICQAVLAGRHEAYVLWFWRWIMLIIRCIPEWQFKKMKM